MASKISWPALAGVRPAYRGGFCDAAALPAANRQWLEDHWPGVFRHAILELLPVATLRQHFDPDLGRPTRELYSLAGLILLRACMNWTKEQAVAPVLADLQASQLLPQELLGDTHDPSDENVQLPESYGVELVGPVPGAAPVERPEDLNIDDFVIDEATGAGDGHQSRRAAARTLSAEMSLRAKHCHSRAEPAPDPDRGREAAIMSLRALRGNLRPRPKRP